jgi:hypothetical protein
MLAERLQKQHFNGAVMMLAFDQHIKCVRQL